MQRETRGPSVWAVLSMSSGSVLLLWAIIAAWIVATSIWVAGSTAAWLSSNPTVPYGGGLGFVLTAWDAGSLWDVWPSTPRWLLITCLTIMVALFAGLWTLTQGLIGRFGGSTSGLAGAKDLGRFGQNARAKEALRLRPSLTKTTITDHDLGLPLGSLNGQTLWAGIEDTVTSWMAPRAGKTTSLGIPQAISAPGALVATSNKADLWQATALHRARHSGAVWAFDPQQIANQAPTWWWNPLAQVSTYEDSMELASMFLPKRSEDRNAYFTDRGRLYLGYLLLAAASHESKSLRLVQRWLDTNRDGEPIQHLKSAGHHSPARGLASMIEEDSRETIEGVFSTAVTAAQALKSEAIMEWVCPHPDRAEFDVTQFLMTRDSLYLLSREGDISAAPLIAAFVDQLFTAGRTLAGRTPGGRLDPPLTVILDEAANIVRIPTLPDNYSYFGSLGILVHAIFQSKAQATAAWGREGAEKLWSASTVKLIGPGTDDADLARTIAQFVGSVEVDRRSMSYSSRMGAQQSISTSKEPLWGPADVRGLEPGTALLLASGIRPAVINLVPWWETPHKTEIEADIETTTLETLRKAQSARTLDSEDH